MTAPATTIQGPITLFAPIDLSKASKQSDGTLIVDCVVSTENADDQGEIVTYDALKKAATDYMTWANVREMHQPSAVGTTLELHLDDDLRKATAVVHVVDPVAVQKVETGVYKGVSIGGKKLAVGALEKVAGKSIRKVTEILWNELSLADRPSNGDAVLTLAKRSGGDEGQAEASSDTSPNAADGDDLAKTSDDAQDAPVTAAEPEVATDTTPEAAAAPDPAAAADGGSEDNAAVADEPAALAQAAPTGDLAKSAADNAIDVGYVLTQLAFLAESEGLEKDGEDVASLHKAMKTLQAYQAKQLQATGTPEDVADRIEEIAEAKADDPVAVVVVGQLPMYYAAVTGDLAKRALELAKASTPADPDASLDQLITYAIAAGGRCEHALAKAAGETPASDPDPELLAKVADAAFARQSDALLSKVTTAIGPIVRPEALDAVKGEILEALAPLREELAKIAAQPAPGGPARYALEGRRFDGAITAASEADVLSKAAQSTTDPAAKEAIGRLAAEAAIRAQHQGA